MTSTLSIHPRPAHNKPTPPPPKKKFIPSTFNQTTVYILYIREFRLHSRELRDKFRRHTAEVRKHLLGALPHAGLVVVHPVMLAEGLHQGVDLSEVVAGDLGEEVVVHLVLESPAEPVDERRARYVPGCGHLREDRIAKHT